MQTIALASTQFLQPVWSLATAPGVALSGWQTQPSLPAVIDTASDHAEMPKKEVLHRAASPLLEEMLESPVTAAKPAGVNSATSRSRTPGRQALHMGSPVHSGSIHQTAGQLQSQGTLLSCNVGETSSSMPEQSTFTVETPPEVSAQDFDTNHASVSGTELTTSERLCAHATVSLMEADAPPAAHIQEPVSCDACPVEPCTEFGTAQAPADTDVLATSNSASPSEEDGSTCAEQHADKGRGVQTAAEQGVLQLANIIKSSASSAVCIIMHVQVTFVQPTAMTDCLLILAYLEGLHCYMQLCVQGDAIRHFAHPMHHIWKQPVVRLPSRCNAKGGG